MCRKKCCTRTVRHTTIISRHLECFRDILTVTPTKVYFRPLLKWRCLFHRRASYWQLVVVDAVDDTLGDGRYFRGDCTLLSCCRPFLPTYQWSRLIDTSSLLGCSPSKDLTDAHPTPPRLPTVQVASQRRPPDNDAVKLHVCVDRGRQRATSTLPSAPAAVAATCFALTCWLRSLAALSFLCVHALNSFLFLAWL